MTREELIIARVRTENMMADICGDEYASMEVKEKMLNHAWTLPAESLGIFEAPPAQSEDCCVYAEALQEMAQNKDIMCQIPAKTPFRFIKRIINRILRLTNRYQQAFNNAVFRMLNEIRQDFSVCKKTIADMGDQWRNYADSATQIQEQLSQEVKDQAQVQEQLSQEVKDQAQAQEQLSLEVKDQAEISKKISLTVQEQAEAQGKISSELESQAEAVKELSRQMEELQERLRGASEEEEPSYAQCGEDGIIAYMMRVMGIPYAHCDYLDLGANHPKKLSNTYFFYEHGAHGVLVEANPDLIPALERERPRDVTLNRLIASERGVEPKEFYIMSGDGLSTTERESVETALRENPDLFLVEKIKVPCVSVMELFEKYFIYAPKILNVDVEGIEMEILQSIDFEKYRPLVIVVEMIPYKNYLVSGMKDHEVEDFLESKGYVEQAFTGINSIFLDTRSEFFPKTDKE